MVHGIRQIRQTQKKISGHSEILGRIYDQLRRYLLCFSLQNTANGRSIDSKDFL